jgi:short-chain fatty acids transporter
MGALKRTARPFVVFVERYYPDPFVFVIALTVVTLVAAVLLTGSSVTLALTSWGDGLPLLLAFMAQIAVTLITAHALAQTDAVGRLLTWLGRQPRNHIHCYLLVTLVSGIASLLSWGIGLIAGAIIARQVAVQASERGIRVHYPLLVACAYAGFSVWHMGYSGSAPLFVATPGNAMEDAIGRLIPVQETMLARWNILGAVFSLVVIAAVCALMHPNEEEVIEAPVDKLKAAASRETDQATVDSVAERLDNSRSLSVTLALLLSGYLAHWFWTRGFELTLDVVNWTFLCLGLWLARSPVHYIRLVRNAGTAVSPVLIQYPFYAGIMGMMAGTGLVALLSDWFARTASAQSLPFWAFVSGGIVNFFVPSGGGQWAVQGPIFIEAAKTLGTDPALIVMGVAYGDQWSNLIQPFWAIPLLAVAGLHLRQMMGYTFVIFIVTFFTFGGTIFLASH